MKRKNIYNLQWFLAVAKERSFTKAAAKIGISTSALSYSIRGLETRIGTRLLTRTTHSISPLNGNAFIGNLGHFQQALSYNSFNALGWVILQRSES